MYIFCMYVLYVYILLMFVVHNIVFNVLSDNKSVVIKQMLLNWIFYAANAPQV